MEDTKRKNYMASRARRRFAASLWIDQHGNRCWARTLKELRSQIPGSVSRMFVDHKDGSVYHVGYVVGKHWLREFTPAEVRV